MLAPCLLVANPVLCLESDFGMPQLRKMKVLLVWASFCEVSTPQPKYSNRQLGVEQVAARLGEMSEVRKVALKSYESRRLMTVAYQGPMGQGEAMDPC